MLLAGQWIVFVVAALLGVVLVWYAAKYLLKLVLVVVVAGVIIYGLHQLALLPEPAQKYIDELFSQENIQAAQNWMRQWTGAVPEKASTPEETPPHS
jgi:hypothetical protein